VAGVLGERGFADGPASTAKFDYANGIVVDPRTGNLIVCDRNNHRIRSVSKSGVFKVHNFHMFSKDK